MTYADKYCTYTESFLGGEHVYVYKGKCVITRKHYEVRVPGSELFAYRRGALIQDAFPSLSAADREFLLTGISPEGWELLPKEEEEDY